MTMRIWYQSMTPVRHLPNYFGSLTKHAGRACSKGTQIEVHGLEGKYFEGSSPTEVYNYSYAKHRITQQVMEIARYAEAQGFAGFILGSFSEPFLTETRSAVDIPVVSMAESCVLTACSLGEKVALVSLSKGSGRRLMKILQRHQLSDRVMALALPEFFDENRLNASFSDPDDIIRAFTAAARQAMADGADVVIPAEGVMNEVLFQNGIHEIEGGTILDSVGVTMLHAEMMVNLKSRCGVGTGRRWAYAKSPPHLLPPLQIYSDEERGT